MRVQWKLIVEVAVSIAGAQLSFYKNLKHGVLNKNLCGSKGFPSQDYIQFIVTATCCCVGFVQNWIFEVQKPVVCQIMWPTLNHTWTLNSTLGCVVINFIDSPIKIPVTFICGWKLYDNWFWVGTSCWLPIPVTSVCFLLPQYSCAMRKQQPLHWIWHLVLCTIWNYATLYRFTMYVTSLTRVVPCTRKKNAPLNSLTYPS